MNEKIDIHKTSLDTRKESLKNWKIPEAVKKDLLSFVEDLEMGKVNKGKRLNERTQLKYLNTLKTPLEYLNLPLNKITLKDLENFEKDISSGKIKSIKNKPYSHSVKVDMRLSLKIMLRWKLGLEKANKLTDWFDCRDIKSTPDFLSEKEIEKLYKNCKSHQERFLIAVLFDSGARIEEFLNIRYEDIKQPNNKDNFFKITFKEEYSKTMGRTISLYWKYSTEAIKDFLEQRIREGIKTNEAVYNSTYEGCRAFLRRLGIKVLDKGVHPHLFRHSSATYYANKLNRQELCIRYGWKFSSDMPDVYISRAGMENKELDEKFAQTELGDLKTQLEKQELMLKMKSEELENVKKENEKSDNTLQEVSSDIVELRENLIKLVAEDKERRAFDPILDKLLQNPKVQKQFEKIFQEQLNLASKAKKRGIGEKNVPTIKAEH